MPKQARPLLSKRIGNYYLAADERKYQILNTYLLAKTKKSVASTKKK
jgi:hypothetical protein